METSSPGIIYFFFAVVMFMLALGVVGTFIIDENSLSTLVAGILFMIALSFTIIFRQVILEVDPSEVALCWGTERRWIPREEVSSIEPLELTMGRRFAAFVSLGPWSAVGREKIHYFGGKRPMVLITTGGGYKVAISVDDPDEVIRVLNP